VDVHAVRSKRELLEALSGALALPDSFGRNWDALADSLQDLPVPENGWLLHLEHGSALQAPLGSDWLTLLEILGEAAIYWKGRGRAFVVLIDGATELPLWR
jgi:RNAse (barnase) inhibitor barstar